MSVMTADARAEANDASAAGATSTVDDGARCPCCGSSVAGTSNVPTCIEVLRVPTFAAPPILPGAVMAAVLKKRPGPCIGVSFAVLVALTLHQRLLAILIVGVATALAALWWRE